MLLDTHIFLWSLLQEQGGMGPQTWKLMQTQHVQAIISAVCIFEIRQKQRRGKLAHIDTTQVLENLKISQAAVLDVSPEHALCTPTADVFAHGDPFDLLLIAQAISEKVPLLTCDSQILKAQIPGLRLIDGRN